MASTDAELGLKVRDYLIEKGVESPIKDEQFSPEEKIKQIESKWADIINILGYDINDESLMESPKRISKMMVKELFKGTRYVDFPKCTSFTTKSDSIVLVKDIQVMSTCEHHFVTIDGLASVAYIPKNVTIGLSKLNRIVDFFSRRPQVQERLTEQIFYALEYILETSDIAVFMDATHYCVKARGVRDQESKTTTSKLGGVFREEGVVRNELFQLLK